MSSETLESFNGPAEARDSMDDLARLWATQDSAVVFTTARGGVSVASRAHREMQMGPQD
jgi:hypothetical protein